MQSITGRFRSKLGMALAELMVSLALLGIVSTMIVSFSAVAKDHVAMQQSQYAFLEETGEIKKALAQWLSQMDESTLTCVVSAEKLSAPALNGAASFEDGSLVLTRDGSETARVDTETVTRVEFVLKSLPGGNMVVKCTVTGAYERDERYDQTFLLALRCGSFSG